MPSALVLGLGVSGKAAASLLLEKGYSVFGTDRNPVALDSVPFLEQDSITTLCPYDILVVSPGISPAHPLYRKALEEKVEIISEVELGLRYLSNKRVIGITGTNGKTTTTNLIEHVLLSSGYRAKAVGNVGTPLSTVVLNPNFDTLVLELSSFQLERMYTPKLTSAAILNITPDHLDRYANFDAYVQAKMRIASLLQKGAPLFLHPSCPKLEGAIAFSEDNIEVASLLCQHEGVTKQEFIKAIETFKKPPHRLEFVANVQGVDFYNDSKATNVASTLYAIAQMSGPIQLIVGGVDKGSSYASWKKGFLGVVENLFLIGSAREKIATAMKGVCPIHLLDNLEEAVCAASRFADGRGCVLLSPGCSSYDQYPNFEKRGEHFISSVYKLVDTAKEKSYNTKIVE